MNIQCSSCQTRLRVDPTKYTQTVVVVQCSNCGQKLKVRLLEKEQAPPEPLQAIVIEEPEVKTSHEKPKDVFNNPFSFKGRIRRTEYWVSSIVGIMIYIVLLEMISNDVPSVILLILLLFLGWLMLAQSAKRCHDIGNSGWFQLIPFYILVLLFQEGQKHPNKYGDPVKK